MTKQQVLFLLALIWLDVELSHRAIASDDDSNPKWQTVKLIEEEGYSFRLRYRAKASIADEDWLQLECENRDSPMMFLDNIHFRIEYETQPTGYPQSGLVHAGPYDLFPWAWDKSPAVEKIKFERGQTRSVIETLSNQGSGNLGEPPEAGLEYIGRVHLTVDLSFGHRAGRQMLRTPLHGIPMEFEWVRPDADGYARLRKRLRMWLQSPGHRASRYDTVVRRLFEMPNVSDELSTAELVTAIEKEQVPGHARVSAIRCLFERGSRESEEIGFDRDKLVNDQNMIAVLKRYAWPRHPWRLWCSRFANPLVQALSNHELPVDVKDQAVEVLLRFPDDWNNNPQWVQQVKEADEQRQSRRRQRELTKLLQLIGLGLISLTLAAGAVLLILKVVRWRKRARLINTVEAERE